VAAPRVLFVSKPVAPPWHDGSKNLVRDVAEHLAVAEPTVMTVEGGPALGGRVTCEPVYRDAGRFAPGLAANARVVRRLIAGEPLDVWHFVFAPNPASSAVARAAIRARRLTGWRGKVVQTVASAPKSFSAVRPLLFGDVVVALSEHTRGHLLGAGATRPIRVIPPCARAPENVHDARIAAARAAAGVGDAPYVLYPGDYEVSTGAATFADAVAPLTRDRPGLRCVFACRKKTPRADEAEARIQARLGELGVAERARHAGEVTDMHALVAGALAVAFPVDDLYGKVDLPLVLLEAAALGVPVVAASGGPLEGLEGAISCEPRDPAALAEALGRLVDDAGHRAEVGARLKNVYHARFSPPVVAAAYDALYAELCAK